MPLDKSALFVSSASLALIIEASKDDLEVEDEDVEVAIGKRIKKKCEKKTRFSFKSL